SKRGRPRSKKSRRHKIRVAGAKEDIFNRPASVFLSFFTPQHPELSRFWAATSSQIRRCVAVTSYADNSRKRKIIMHKTLVALTLSSALVGVALAETAAPKFITPQSNDFISSRVVGLDVYDNANHDLGKIQDIVFDPSMAIKGYILSVGGFLGMGERYVAVDPASVVVKYDDNDKKWHANMNATSDQLKAAPEFKYSGRWNSSKS